MGAIRVSGELNNIRFLETQHLLEPTTDGLQNLFTLSWRTGVLVSGVALAHSPRPETNTIESLTDVHNNTHHFVVVVVLEGLANRSQLSVQPEIINGYGALVLERVRPLATVLVLKVFPLWPDAFLEKVIICLQAQLGGGCDVVLIQRRSANRLIGEVRLNEETYVDSPELLHRVECNNFLQQIVPVVALHQASQLVSHHLNQKICPYLATGRLGKPKSPLVHQRVLDVEVLRVVEHSDGVSVRLRLLGDFLLFGGHGAGGGVLVVHRRGAVFCNGGHCDRR